MKLIDQWVKPVLIIFVFSIGIPYIFMKLRPSKPGKEEDYAPKRHAPMLTPPKVNINTDYESRDVRAMKSRLRKKQEESKKQTKSGAIKRKP